MDKLYIPTRKKKRIAKILTGVKELLKEIKEELKKIVKEKLSQNLRN